MFGETNLDVLIVSLLGRVHPDGQLVQRAEMDDLLLLKLLLSLFIVRHSDPTLGVSENSLLINNIISICYKFILLP
jgi:hypothetical protein